MLKDNTNVNIKAFVRWWLEFFKTMCFVAIIVIPTHSFAFKPYKIPSESMLNNLMVGDYLIVSKMAYGYTKHSLPFSVPLIDGRIFASDIERGDVVVFRLPRDPSEYYIKRIVGLPGDKIQTKGGKLYLNDKELPTQKLEDYVRTNINGRTETFSRFEESMPNGKSYTILDREHNPGSRSDDSEIYIVPEGHYFAMGDNRDNSLDSRWPKSIGVGFVPDENIIGKAKWRTLSFDNKAEFWEVWKWFPKERRERFFSDIN